MLVSLNKAAHALQLRLNCSNTAKPLGEARIFISMQNCVQCEFDVLMDKYAGWSQVVWNIASVEIFRNSITDIVGRRDWLFDLWRRCVV
jgi:hypothetical protein